MNIFLNEYFGFCFELNFELNHFSARFNEKMNFQNVSNTPKAPPTAPARPGRAIPSMASTALVALPVTVSSAATSPTPAVSSAVPTAASIPTSPTPAVSSAVPTAASVPTAPTTHQSPTLAPPVYGLTAWLHQIQPVLMFSVLMVALSVTVCVSQLGGSLACAHLADRCLPRRPAIAAPPATGSMTAAPLHSFA